MNLCRSRDWKSTGRSRENIENYSDSAVNLLNDSFNFHLWLITRRRFLISISLPVALDRCFIFLTLLELSGHLNRRQRPNASFIFLSFVLGI